VLARYTEMSQLVEELLDEHRQLTSMVDALRAGGDKALLDEFTGMLTRHVRKEEGVLFEEAQRLLPPEELASLGRSLVHQDE
jgi:hemerythrin-like domain-containing protein